MGVESSGRCLTWVRESEVRSGAVGIGVTGLGLNVVVPVVLVVFLLLLCPVAVVAQDADLVQGKALYESQCGSCHGPMGNGGKGANLAQPQLRRASTDEALVNIVRRGIRGTEMPGSPLTRSQASSIAAYVRTLGRVDPEEVPGNLGRGQAIYSAQDCSQCHTLGGRGGVVGPALDDIGARRSAAHLREALLEPEATVPSDFLLLRVVTKDGRVLGGVRVNEDGFSIQFRDLSGQLHSFWKDELDTLEQQWQRSPMASYEASIAGEQMDDLVAYLVSLKGAQ